MSVCINWEHCSNGGTSSYAIERSMGMGCVREKKTLTKFFGSTSSSDVPIVTHVE